MKRRDRAWLLGGGACVLLSGVMAWAFGAGHFGDQLDKLELRRTTYGNFLRKVRTQREARPELDVRLANVFERTLGADRETVDSVLRKRLAILADDCGLARPSVTTFPAAVRESPAKRTFRRSGVQRAFRDEPDFVEVRGGIVAVGSIDNVVCFMHALDASPWLKRINTVRMDPEDDGARLRLTVRLTTLYVPGQSPSEASLNLQPAPRRSLDRYAGLIEANPFALPPKPKPEPTLAVVQPPPPPPPVVDPRSFWRLTGIMEGPDGIEAWFMNVQELRAIEVRPGESLAGVAMESAEGDIAVFSVGDETFRILVGSTLDRPLP